MFAAPPVAVRCTAGWAWRGLQAALPALATGILAYWSLATWAEDVPRALHFGLPPASALAVAALAWWRSAALAQTLDWDGQRWALDGRPGDLQLMVDVGRVMLLRHGGNRWLLARRGEAGGAWHALRVAVLARGPSATGTTDDGWLNA